MSKNVRTQIGKVVGKSLDAYHKRTKPTVDELKFKEQYQGRIIDCMVGEVDDNYIETPETDMNIVKLEHSREGVVKIPSIKGKTILVDADGNETDTPAEGCRLVSVGESEDNKLIILSKNKNLCDKVVYGDILQTDGGFIKSVSVVRSNHIKVKPNTVYRISETLVASSDWMAIFEYDKNKKFIQYHYNKHMRTSSETHYIAFKYHNGENIKSKFQLEEGEYKTSYIEPKYHKTEILLNEPLRSIPNGVYDEIVDNKIIRRTAKVVLDGVRNKFRDNYSASASVEGFYSYRYDNENIPLKSWGSMDCVICNKYPSVNYGAWNSPTENCVSVHSSIKAIYVSLQNDMLDITSSDNVTTRANKANKWLKENPIEIVYELAEPIIEELPNSITTQGFDDTTMYIENSVTPTVTYGYNALIPYKNELSQQKEEVEINTLDIENNIIPYLLDMEFNLMLMEDK